MRRVRQGSLRIFAICGLLVAAILVILWQSGGLDGLTYWASQRQREAQTLMAGALRRLRAGEPGASLALIGISFGYGFLHAAGPGHGKMLIGGYGFGTDVSLRRLSFLAVISSLAQAGTAVGLVWGGITLFDLSREALTELSEDVMADLSAAMIGAIGIWLGFRGIRQILRIGKQTPSRHHHAHHPQHVHDENCGCGHAHGPTPREVAETRSLRDALILIAGIAARPCTGALFLLLLTWRMGIFPTGVAAAFAMGLGTASVTLLVALLSVWARQGSFALMVPDGSMKRFAKWLPGILQLVAGSVVAFMSWNLLS